MLCSIYSPASYIFHFIGVCVHTHSCRSSAGTHKYSTCSSLNEAFVVKSGLISNGKPTSGPCSASLRCETASDTFWCVIGETLQKELPTHSVLRYFYHWLEEQALSETRRAAVAQGVKVWLRTLNNYPNLAILIHQSLN